MKNKTLIKYLLSLYIVHCASCIPVFAQDYKLSKRDTSEIKWVSGKKFYQIKVAAGETIYSISKRFDVAQDEIKSINPAVKDGLKLNMELLIPAKVAVRKSDLPEIKKEQPQAAKVFSKNYINVALCIPLSLSKNALPDISNPDSSLDNSIDRDELLQIEFYEGVQLALDSLSKGGRRFHLSVIDTENDSLRIAMQIKSGELHNVDIILNNSNASVLRALNRFSKENKVKLISCTPNSAEVMRDNSLSIALQPSSYTQCLEAGKFAVKHFIKPNIIALKTSQPKENERIAAFTAGWNSINTTDKIKIVDYTKPNFNKIFVALKHDCSNVLFIPSSNEDGVSSIFGDLFSDSLFFDQVGDSLMYSFSVVGIPTWLRFDAIDPMVMQKMNTCLFTSSNVNFESEEMKRFRVSFRNDYGTEPEESAVQGFDAMMIAGEFHSAGSSDKLNNHDGIFTSYNFSTVDGVKENTFVRFVGYNDYQIVELK